MKIILSIILLSIFVNLINSHAVLISPTPFSTNPSKISLCGGGALQTVAQTSFCPGRPTTVKWQVVVGDGTGEVKFRLSTNGGITDADFKINLAATVIGGVQPNAVASWFYNITIPTGTVCDNGKCVLQAASSSNWFSCSVINVQDSVCTQAATEAPLKPVKINRAVSFCTEVTNKVVLLPDGTDVTQLDTITKQVFTNNMANPLVIGTNTTQCGNLYKPVLCGVTFPLNPGSDGVPLYQVTKEQCEQFISTCGVDSHKALYPCDVYPSENSSSIIIVPALLILSILSMFLLF